MSQTDFIDIRELKRTIRKNYSEDAPIRVILSEPDEISKEEYSIKLMVWWRLIPLSKKG
jgi:hypothetical protein